MLTDLEGNRLAVSDVAPNKGIYVYTSISLCAFDVVVCVDLSILVKYELFLAEARSLESLACLNAGSTICDVMIPSSVFLAKIKHL